MLNARLAALAAVLIWISTLVPQTIFAQDAEGLPPGIRSVEVDGQPIDATATPVTNNPTPEISGRVAPFLDERLAVSRRQASGATPFDPPLPSE